MCVYVYIYIYTCVCVYIYIYIYVCISIYLSLYLSLSLSLYIYIYIYIYIDQSLIHGYLTAISPTMISNNEFNHSGNIIIKKTITTVLFPLSLQLVKV